ncbi:adenine nucleotide alpha hydrolases-like protein, partial [Saccharata proteae CBS 121410]
PFPALCARLDERISSFLEQEQDVLDARLMAVQEQTKVALAVIDEALQKYSLPELSLSYNGGKDCLVLLILYLAALHRRGLAHSTPALQSVYIQSSHPFAEVEQFVAHSVRTYSLALATYAAPMKEAFASYLRDTPAVKAIFVGTRRTDPHGEHLTHFDPTDHGWPSFMRIHPVIDWHYVEIWTFIRHLSIPYCPLYDQGYTSLGGTTDTHPNPALRVSPSSSQSNGDNKPTPAYRPAYELVEDYEERLGRD